MSTKQPDRSQSSTREDRLAKALRENLARRKALVRARRAKDEDDTADSETFSGRAEAGAHDEEPPS